MPALIRGLRTPPHPRVQSPPSRPTVSHPLKLSWAGPEHLRAHTKFQRNFHCGCEEKGVSRSTPGYSGRRSTGHIRSPSPLTHSPSGTLLGGCGAWDGVNK